MSDPLLTSYEEIPYESVPRYYTHPHVAATVGTILGMSPAPIERCRVLELGCATGGNLVPMAMLLPGSSFVGIDLSPRQIAAGQAVVDALGLSNLSLKAMSILDIDRSMGEFDYIIVHGVYSWVPREVQEKILAVCKENLAADGIAYISYNTYPGWHFRGMVREMLGWHARQFQDPRQQVQQARAFLEAIADLHKGLEGPFGEALREEAALLSNTPDSYVYHEHLEETNFPIYFHEFARRAESHGLEYLCEARPSQTSIGMMPPQTQAILEKLPCDRISREQYMDFLRNRTFRRSLLCHAGKRPAAGLDPLRLRGMYLEAQAKPMTRGADPTVAAVEEFSTVSMQKLTTGSPPVRAALHELYESHPALVPFAELLDRVRARTKADVDEGALARAMLQCYMGDMVVLNVYRYPCVGHITERPRAFELARLHAADGLVRLPNPAHRMVEIDEFDRLVCEQLDGRHTRQQIVDGLALRAGRGEFGIENEKGESLAGAELAEALAQRVDQSLRGLCQRGLLVG